MQSIESLLKRHKKTISSPNKHVCISVQKVIQDICNISVSIQSLSYQHRIIRLKPNFTARDIVLGKKKQILSTIAAMTGEQIKDIK